MHRQCWRLSGSPERPVRPPVSGKPFSVVGTGVDPVTSRFSGGPWRFCQPEADELICENCLFSGHFWTAVYDRSTPLTTGIPRSVGHGWGTKFADLWSHVFRVNSRFRSAGSRTSTTR
jgi:hypothetical protein